MVGDHFRGGRRKASALALAAGARCTTGTATAMAGTSRGSGTSRHGVVRVSPVPLIISRQTIDGLRGDRYAGGRLVIAGEYGPMEFPQTGGCQCGALRYEITQAPIMVYTCHCTDCQRMTSSAFSLGCVLPDGAFRLVQGQPKGVQRTTGSGRVSTRWVCPECGVWVCTAPRPGGTAGACPLASRPGCPPRRTPW